MNLDTTVEAVLRDAGFETWHWEADGGSAVCFEGEAVLGFCHAFATVAALLEGWPSREAAALRAHTSRLRASGEKAWNIYTVLLTGDEATETQQRAIALIEEDLSRSRKIARAGMVAQEPVELALSPLLPLRVSAAAVAEDDLADRIRRKLSDLPSEAVEAFLRNDEPSDIVAHLRGTQ
jgi:hypothetical protein